MAKNEIYERILREKHDNYCIEDDPTGEKGRDIMDRIFKHFGSFEILNEWDNKSDGSEASTRIPESSVGLESSVDPMSLMSAEEIRASNLRVQYLEFLKEIEKKGIDPERSLADTNEKIILHDSTFGGDNRSTNPLIVGRSFRDTYHSARRYLGLEESSE